MNASTGGERVVGNVGKHGGVTGGRVSTKYTVLTKHTWPSAASRFLSGVRKDPQVLTTCYSLPASHPTLRPTPVTCSTRQLIQNASNNLVRRHNLALGATQYLRLPFSLPTICKKAQNGPEPKTKRQYRGQSTSDGTTLGRSR